MKTPKAPTKKKTALERAALAWGHAKVEKCVR